MVWSLLLIAGSEGPTLISLAASHLHTVGVFAAHVVAQFFSGELPVTNRRDLGIRLIGGGPYENCFTLSVNSGTGV